MTLTVTGDVEKRPYAGRPSVLTKTTRNAIVRGLLGGESSKQLEARLAVSQRSINRAAREAGLAFRTTSRTPPLTPRHRRLRMEFARFHLRNATDWTKVDSRRLEPCPLSYRSRRVVALPVLHGSFNDETLIRSSPCCRFACVPGAV